MIFFLPQAPVRRTALFSSFWQMPEIMLVACPVRLEFAMNLVEGICVEDLQRRIFDPSAELQLTEFLRLDRIMFPDFQGDFSGPRILRAIVLEQYTAVEEVPLKNLVFGRMPRAIEFERIEEFGIDVGFSK